VSTPRTCNRPAVGRRRRCVAMRSETNSVRSCLGSRHLPVRPLGVIPLQDTHVRATALRARPEAPRSRPRTVTPPRHRGVLVRAPWHPAPPVWTQPESGSAMRRLTLLDQLELDAAGDWSAEHCHGSRASLSLSSMRAIRGRHTNPHRGGRRFAAPVLERRAAFVWPASGRLVLRLLLGDGALEQGIDGVPEADEFARQGNR
jgi:hypothetical protein